MIQRACHGERATIKAPYVATEKMGSQVPFEAGDRNRQAEMHGVRLKTSGSHANYADSITDEGMTKQQPVPSVDVPTNNFFGRSKA